MKNKTKWKRNCPKCKKILYYGIKKRLIVANKKQTWCKSCIHKGVPLSDNHKKNISLSGSGCKHRLFGKHHSIETKIKMSNSAKGRHVPDAVKEKIRKTLKKLELVNGINNPMYGKSHTLKTKQKIRLKRIKWIEENKNNGFQISPNYNKNSIPLLEQKAKELGITDLQHAENGGEFYLKELGYWADGYSKEKNIVIEYYEPFHKKRIEKDKQRKKEIIKHLKCNFIEIKQWEK